MHFHLKRGTVHKGDSVVMVPPVCSVGHLWPTPSTSLSNVLAWQELDVGAGFCKGELVHNPLLPPLLEEKMGTQA